jgi:hypothetical protein
MPASAAVSPLVATVRHVPREAWIWAVALGALACTDPTAPPLVRLCPLDALGATWCPGCGLGHAVAHLLRGHLAASWAAHPLAAPAVLLLGARIATGLREAARHARRAPDPPASA